MHAYNSTQVLVRPLRALCQHQLDHGAAVHHNKDEVKKNLQVSTDIYSADKCRENQMLL